MQNEVPNLRLNSKFNSYEDVDNACNNYEEEHCIQLWKRDARRVEKMQGRAPNKKFNPSLIYAGLTLCCVHCGKKHKTTSSVAERLKKTFEDKATFDAWEDLLYGINKREIIDLFAKDCIPSHDGRILVVGEFEAGKTTLVMNLIGEVISLERQSTDGIDVHFGKLLYDVNRKTLLKSKSGRHSFPKAIYQKAFACIKHSSEMDRFTQSTVKHQAGVAASVSDTSDDVIESLHKKIKSLQSTENLEDMKYIPIPILDFAGQIVYYATHQTFITANGIYLITLDGSKNLEEFMSSNAVIPGEKVKRTILDNIRLWISSILAYCCHTNKGYPKIVFVATHKDLINVDQLNERKKVIIDSIAASISHDDIKSHLVLNEFFFVNALDKEDPEIDRLRYYLSTLITENPQWGNKVPKQFLILEMMMASLVEEGKDVMSRQEVEDMNKQTGFEELSAEQLELFLHIQYMNGKLTYLDTPQLRNYVIINPTCLIDVLKSIVTAVPSAPELSKGRLHKSSLEAILNSQKFSQIQPYKEYFRNLLVYYDVLAEVRRYDLESGQRVETDEFIVPCMVTTHPEPSLIEELLPPGKYFSFVFVFRGYVVPTALPNRLMASIISIWNASKCRGQELIFSDFLAVNVDRKHDLAIQVEQNLIAVYLIHKQKRELIIRDIASSVRECLEENMMRISEVYSFVFNENMKPERFVPFDLKIRSRCCLHEPKDVLAMGPTCECTDHGQNTPTSELNIWYTDRTATECPQDCQGVSTVVCSMLLNDTQLLRLCNSLSREEVRSLALHLGIKHQILDEIQDEQKTSSMIKFYSLRACREKNKRCTDFLKSMKSSEINVHNICKILRQEEVKTELPDKILTATPSDEMFDKLSIQIGYEWMVFGLELGLEIERLEQIEYENPKNMRETSRRMLSVWRNRDEVATIRDLVDAFGRAGRNPDLIKEILKNCSSFPRIEAAD